VTFAHNILDFGAVVDDSSYKTEVANSNAIVMAFLAANSTENDDRTVEISAGHTFSSMPIEV